MIQYKVCSNPSRLVALSLSINIGFTGSRTSLDHCSDSDSRIRHFLVHTHLLHKDLSHRMLCVPLNQFGLLHSDGAGMLSDMPTFRLQLGSDSPRNLRRSKVPGTIHWGIQLIDGRHNRGITLARPVGASNAGQQKNRSKHPVFHGYSVRKTLFPSRIFFASSTNFSSTC